jgi:hypothetical protein
VKRNSSSSCTYVHGQRDKSSQVQKSTSAPKDVQSQVRHLEELVISLMNKTAKSSTLSGKSQPLITPHGSSVSSSSNATSPGQSSDQVPGSNLDTVESFGRMGIEDDQPNYVNLLFHMPFELFTHAIFIESRGLTRHCLNSHILSI